MREQITTMYAAPDGKLFESIGECKAYEHRAHILNWVDTHLGPGVLIDRDELIEALQNSLSQLVHTLDDLEDTAKELGLR
jgi:hypothetical protein